MDKLLFKFKQFPLLRNIFVTQLLSVLIGFGVLYASFYFAIKSNNDALITKKKNSVKYELMSMQEELRALKTLGLHEKIKEELHLYKNKYGLSKLELIKRIDVSSLGTYAEFVIPEQDDGLSEYVIYGTISIDSIDSFYDIKYSFILIFSLLMFGFVYLIFYLNRFIQKKIYMPIFDLNRVFKNKVIGKKDSIKNIRATGEISRFIENLNKLYDEKKSVDELAMKGKIASQVAHDIKSPLSVLMTLSEDAKGMDESDRIMLRLAVQSIHDIANDLSTKALMNNIDESQESYLIAAVVDNIISEKRIEYKSNQSINIQAQIDRNTYPLFAKLQPTTFKRVLSNLINNSIEAFEGGGDVQVQLKAVEGWVQVVVKDNGKGIPADKLTSIFERGQSYGKDGKDNSGLGLFHAKESVQAWSGTIEVSSEEGVGTEFTISLPLAKQPDWFLGEIVLQPGKDFVIVDDDQSIHEIWKNRLGEAGATVRNMQHFSSADGFESWARQTADLNQYMYLFDYELLGSSKTGLDLVEEFGLQEQAVLVTSRYEEQSIRDRCQKIGLKLLPKGLAGYIPIVKDDSFVSEQPKVDCVLLDDNPLIRMNWERKAAEANLNILTFETSQGLFSKMDSFNKDTIFYVDQHLKDGTLGMDTAKTIKGKGFKRIYLASGFDADEIGESKDVVLGYVGKKPPFGNSQKPKSKPVAKKSDSEDR